MQDAVPMTVGQEFHAFAASLESEIQLLRDAEKYLYEVNMGGTAIGTGLNAPKGYSEKCAAHLAKLTGKPIVPAKDMMAATWDQQGFVVYSAALKSVAIKLSKIAGDLILLASGPRAGLFEIKLPAMQPGSSIMPGKVNPVIPELVEHSCIPSDGKRLHSESCCAFWPTSIECLRTHRRSCDDGIAAFACYNIFDFPNKVYRWNYCE